MALRVLPETETQGDSGEKSPMWPHDRWHGRDCTLLIRLTQFGGGAQKLRPALLLATLPGPYQTHFVCGISTQLSHLRPDWDELIQPSDFAFVSGQLSVVSCNGGRARTAIARCRFPIAAVTKLTLDPKTKLTPNTHRSPLPQGLEAIPFNEA